jgi:tRNA dimethylallyltransferase
VNSTSKIIIVSGPTACRKTALSIELAEKYDAEIVNFDSLLFYRELNIGTAKPSLIERQNIPHHLIDITSAKNPVNASDFCQLANTVLRDIHAKGKLAILVGGSGFYLRALIKGMYESPTTSDETKKRVAELAQKPDALWNFILNNDSESAKLLHPNDQYRLSRAAEHFIETGTPISLVRREMEELGPYDFSRNIHPEWDLLHLHLDLPKIEHQDIIKKRTQGMLQNGLLTEVEQLLNNGFDGNEKPLGSIGYKESVAYLRSNAANLEQLEETICISTRQLAKAQRTFFAKVKPIHRFHPLKDKNQINQFAQEFLS